MLRENSRKFMLVGTFSSFVPTYIVGIAQICLQHLRHESLRGNPLSKRSIAELCDTIGSYAVASLYTQARVDNSWQDLSQVQTVIADERQLFVNNEQYHHSRQCSVVVARSTIVISVTCRPSLSRSTWGLLVFLGFLGLHCSIGIEKPQFKSEHRHSSFFAL